MSTEQTESTAQQPADAPQPAAAEWGAPPPAAAPKSKWTVKRTVIAVAVAVGIAAAGGVAIYAASGSVTNNQGGPGGMGGGPGNGRVFMGGPMAGLESSQHGEFQTGEITAISDDSITAKSTDGYEQTYVINSDTQKTDDLAKGDSVTIIATESNGTVTAVSVLEEGAFGNRQNGGNGGPPNGGGNGNPPNGTQRNGNN
jgi:hypothetical protein